MTTKELQERLMAFSSQIIDLVNQIPKTPAGTYIGKQLLRAGLSIGANYEEAQGAESRADFAHKLQISLKECRESHYWINLMVHKHLGPNPLTENLLNESSQLKAILSKAVVTTKSHT